MKKKLFYSLTMLFGSFNLMQAQNNKTDLLPGMNQSPYVNVNSPRNSAYKTTDTKSRIKMIVYKDYDGVAFVATDSSFINSYTGNNGGGITFQQYLWSTPPILLKYDMATGYKYNTSTTIWDNRNISQQTFDANNNISTKTSQNWDNSTSSWVNSSNDLYQYDANNNQTEDIYRTWNTSTSAWANLYKRLYSYDVNNNRTLYIYQNWNSGTNSWVNSTRTTYTYDANNNVTNQTTQNWNTSTSAWDNSSQINYTYTGNNLTQTINQTWNSSTSAWVNSNKATYTYNGNGDLTDITTQNWNSTTSLFENSSKNIYTYDANHNGLTIIIQHWDNPSSAYVNMYKYLLAYNSYNQITSLTSQYWNSGGLWDYTTSSNQNIFHYETYTTTTLNNISKGGNVAVYPSPANNTVNINLQWDEKQAFNVTIVDAAGRIYTNWSKPATQDYTDQINIQNLANGNYWLIVKGEKGQVVKQFSVMH